MNLKLYKIGVTITEKGCLKVMAKSKQDAFKKAENDLTYGGGFVSFSIKSKLHNEIIEIIDTSPDIGYTRYIK